MSDLISRQETLYILSNLNSAWVGYEKVSRLPTVDAVPVKHGEWMPIQKQPYFRKHFENEVSCSICHKKGHTAWNYCPNCGAKMDGERKDDV